MPNPKSSWAGFYLFECDMLDDAIKYAKMILTAEYGTVEVARVFLDKPATMGQRLARAKISKAGMPFEIPDGEAPTRIDLCEEAVFLTRLMVQLCPIHPRWQASWR
ncbi:MAG: hypothetical protein L3J30_03015 [Marinosulfonomonas sp.]|nr:hypothetical protein [Marinosulfonomonas sp.]